MNIFAQRSNRHGTSIILGIALMFLPALGTDHARADTSDVVPTFSVTTELDQEAQQAPVLIFRLVNEGPGPVEVYESDLPWGIQNSLSLSLFRLDETGCWKVEEYLLIDDPGPGTIVIGRGMTLNGRVDLSGRFDGPKAADRHADFLLRWRYVPMTADLVTGKSSSGWIINPAAQSQ